MTEGHARGKGWPMDAGNLELADKYLLYGLLLKRKRPAAQERRVAAIMRGALGLDEKIEAILALDGDKTGAGLAAGSGSAPPDHPPPPGRRGRKRESALVVDIHPELTRLLKKCALKRRFSFTRVGEGYDAIPLLRRLSTRLIVLNGNLPAEEGVRYSEICRAIVPAIRIIVLGPPPDRPPPDPGIQKAARFLPKPISVARIEETVREWLAEEY